MNTYNQTTAADYIADQVWKSATNAFITI